MYLSILPVIKKGEVYIIDGERLTYVGSESRFRDAGRGKSDSYHVVLYTFKDRRGSEVYFHSQEDLDIRVPSEKEDPHWILALKLFGITVFACISFKIISLLVLWSN